jgi:hypothetical protein
MIDELPRRSVVILSTTPPIPRDYGNRNRVFQTLALFRKLDFAVSFLLYPLDKDWEAQIPTYYKELVSSFNFLRRFPTAGLCISRRGRTTTTLTSGGTIT